VENEADAPAKTKFHWRHEAEGVAVAPRGKATVDGPTTYFPMFAKSVGEGILVQKVAYTAPHQPKGETQTAADLEVVKPTLRRASYETESEGKRRPFFDHMIVGEHLVVTMELGQIDRMYGDDAIRGAAQVSGPLAYEKAKLLSPGIYEIWLKATKTGPAFGVVQALPYETQIGDVPSARV